MDNQTVVINLFGGPGAGKSTCAMEICSELKKHGLSAEYVQEYAKELVYENRMDLWLVMLCVFGIAVVTEIVIYKRRNR